MTSDIYTPANLIRGLRNPSLLVNEVANRKDEAISELSYLPHRTVGKRLFVEAYGDGIDVMERDWDNLIVLDACRYDVFAGHNDINGELSSVVSSGSHSDEFMIANYHGKELHDTVYISANPHTDKTLEPGIFHKTIRTYQNVFWKQRDFDAYHPKIVADIAIDEYDKYDDKRIIVHFMQPHTPYLGPRASDLRSELNKRGVGVSNAPGDAELTDPDDIVQDIMEAARKEYISNNELKQCYVENLELVLTEVRRVLDHLDGRSVITADHGELLGRPARPLFAPDRYGHPRGLFLPETRVVPWLTVDSGTRRNITSEKSRPLDDISEERVTEQLKALGYK